MALTLQPAFNIGLNGYHLWCPSVFRYGHRLMMVVSAWPLSSGFEGWRTHSRIALVLLDEEATRALDFCFLDLRTVRGDSLINPRVIAGEGRLHLFYSIVINAFRYEIGYAKLNTTGASVSNVSTLAITGESREREAHGQGPTNPAPVRLTDGKWRMLYRNSSGVGEKRKLYAAQSTEPSSGCLACPNFP